jgi:hypothetical protein
LRPLRIVVLELVSLDVTHLVGPNSVLTQLEAGGVQVERVRS